MSGVADAHVALEGEGEQHHDADTEAAVAQEELQVSVVEGGDRMVPAAVLAVDQDAPGERQGEQDGEQGSSRVTWKEDVVIGSVL